MVSYGTKRAGCCWTAVDGPGLPRGGLRGAGKTVEASRTAGGTKAKCFCRRSPTTRTWTYHCKGGRRSGRGNASWAVFEQMGELEGFVTAVAHQLRTYIHDILSPHHEKAWRCFPWRTCGRLSWCGDVCGLQWWPSPGNSGGSPMAERRLECLGSDPLRAVTWLQRDTPSLGFSFSTTNPTIKVGLAQGEYLADCAKWQGAGEEGRRRSQAHVWRLWQHWRAAGSGEQKAEVQRSVRPTAPNLFRELFAGRAVLTSKWEEPFFWPAYGGSRGNMPWSKSPNGSGGNSSMSMLWMVQQRRKTNVSETARSCTEVCLESWYTMISIV